MSDSDGKLQQHFVGCFHCDIAALLSVSVAAGCIVCMCCV